MNDEIKEILDNIKNKYEDYYVQDIVSGNDLKQLLDYIINLQQENEELKKKLDRRYYKKEYERIKQENERLKDIVVEKDNQIKEMILQKTDYTAVNILEMKLEDLKKHLEQLKVDLQEANDNAEWWHNRYKALYKALQNGSEDNVSDRD